MKVSWTTKLILSLALLSACFYGINYLVFRDPSFMLRLVTLQLGFVPISVLLITLFVNRLIANREKGMRLEKVNTIIGSFFSEVGTPLLKLFRDFDPKCHELSQKLIPTGEWSDADFRRRGAQAGGECIGVMPCCPAGGDVATGRNGRTRHATGLAGSQSMRAGGATYDVVAGLQQRAS